eukprot:6378549-Prymnesium_polylepis.1
MAQRLVHPRIAARWASQRWRGHPGGPPQPRRGARRQDHCNQARDQRDVGSRGRALDRCGHHRQRRKGRLRLWSFALPRPAGWHPPVRLGVQGDPPRGGGR